MVFGGGKPKQLITTNQYMQWRRDPFQFIKEVWGLSVQEKGKEFVKGQMITWQQGEIVQAVKDAVNGKGRNKISVRSGKGIGKSTVISMLIYWFLFCYKDCIIPCTAPTESHLQVVLWKELSLWLNRMPTYMQKVFSLTSSFLRMVANPDAWFAMAKVGKKESSEGIQGIHAEWIFAVVDEASGVADEIFMALQGIYSSANVIMLMISNPTRLTGYFHDSHMTDLKDTFKCLAFNGEESPIVDKQLINDIIARWGKDSEQYKIDILGEFPSADSVDDAGYINLLSESDLHYCDNHEFVGTVCLGVDPAGEGDDETVWVIRDTIKAKVVKKQKISTGKGIAGITATIMTQYDIKDHNVIIDNFGVGVDCIQELAYMGYMVNSLYLGKESNNKDVYMNKRAELSWVLRERLKKGGELVDAQEEGWKECLSIKYRRTEQNQIQIKPKREMKKEGIKSPNVYDALMLSMDADLAVSAYNKPVFAKWFKK